MASVAMRTSHASGIRLRRFPIFMMSLLAGGGVDDRAGPRKGGLKKRAHQVEDARPERSPPTASIMYPAATPVEYASTFLMSSGTARCSREQRRQPSPPPPPPSSLGRRSTAVHPHHHVHPRRHIVAAWISADTGVDPPSRSGKPHVQRDLRRLPARPRNSNSAAAVHTPAPIPGTTSAPPGCPASPPSRTAAASPA